MHFSTSTVILLVAVLSAAAPTPQLDVVLSQLTDPIPRPGEDPANSISDLTAALGSAVNAIPGSNGGTTRNSLGTR